MCSSDLYDDVGMMKLSRMVGHQLPFLSVFIPFYVIVMMAGFKKAFEVMPAILVCGVTFAVAQYATASFVGPYLPDITASLAAMIGLVLLLRVWQPKENYVFAHESAATKEEHNYTAGQIFRAWTPYVFLTLMVLLWGIPSIKAELDKSKMLIPIAGLDNMIIKKVSTPEVGATKLAAAVAEIDKTLASLPAGDAKLSGVVGKLGELKTLEAQLLVVEQKLAGQGASLPPERLAALEPVMKKNAELQDAVKGLVKDQVVAKDKFGALTKALNDQLPAKVAAKYTFNFMSAAGTAILIAALLSALVCGVGFGDVIKIAGKTLFDMRFPAVTVASVLGLAYIMNASGMTNCLGLAFTKTGHWFPFLAPLLGWLGVFLTGSDTSSNVLFGGLQKATAEQLGINPILTGAANTSGGVMGKMISQIGRASCRERV